VVSRTLGERAAGIYWIAWPAANIPVDTLGTLTGTVALSFFSAAQSRKDVLRSDFLRLNEGLAVVTFPACLGLALVAPDFVAVVLGSQWKAVAVPLALLCLYAPVRTLVMVQPHLLLAVGQRRFVTWNMVLAAIVMPAGFIVGTRWGLAGVASAWFLLYPVVSFALCRRSLRMLDMNWRTFAAALGAPFVSTDIMWTAIVIVSFSILSDVGSVSRLIVSVLLGTIVYGASMAVLFPQRLQTILRMLKAKNVGSQAILGPS